MAAEIVKNSEMTTRLWYDSNDQLRDLNSAVEALRGLPSIVDRLRSVGSEDADVRATEILSALSRVATAVEDVTGQVSTPEEHHVVPERLGYIFVVS